MLNYNPLDLYQVTEIEAALVIHLRGAKIGNSNAAPLAAGPLEAMCEYVTRYTHARMRGITLDDAHRIALKGAKILEPGREAKIQVGPGGKP